MERPSGDGSGAGGALVPATRSMVPTTGVKVTCEEVTAQGEDHQREGRVCED